MRKVNDVEILILSSRLDFTTDYVCLELDNRRCKYLRINRDEFADYLMTLDVETATLIVERRGVTYKIAEPRLKAIYFRAPTYLRDIYQPDLPEDVQLYRTQWAAFVRNLSIFENVFWMNNPVSTFKAENKLLQLKYAQKVGFVCPATIVTNTCPKGVLDEQEYIVKSIDSAILRIGDQEAFVYANAVKGHVIKAAKLSLAPIMIQNYIHPKIDFRITVVCESVYPVKILADSAGVEGDWRQQGHEVDFFKCDLPDHITKSCVNLVNSLGLAFGAIDLVQCQDLMYFLEINPTGEWGWLVRRSGLPIAQGICNCLEGSRV
jgi:glutathione synthase/RimK-type ligase-like ATP-grasp enzyme